MTPGPAAAGHSAEERLAALGLALPVAYELVINRRVRCRDDFERGFSIPVLMEFDGMPVGTA